MSIPYNILVITIQKVKRAFRQLLAPCRVTVLSFHIPFFLSFLPSFLPDSKMEAVFRVGTP